MTPAVW